MVLRSPQNVDPRLQRLLTMQNTQTVQTKYSLYFFFREILISRNMNINPLRPNRDESQTSHCNIKGVSVSEVMRIENMITQVQFY